MELKTKIKVSIFIIEIRVYKSLLDIYYFGSSCGYVKIHFLIRLCYFSIWWKGK